ncbi:hypothetical protein [Amycolatopsis echigonensis]|uniref:Uncharacterized protein n=1 Tax=Amycolatopsis echigonensis TaxID=2576905 RepID=A0A8E1VZH7_9PSEU|nr:hypothetical protein [Amycolatopsis echigonensis]MBB2501191.1 hypothetical protein [Amycolatopsis echigonensis]
MNTAIYPDTKTLVQNFRQHTIDEIDGWSVGWRGMRVEADACELQSWLAGFDGAEAALVELHATMLRSATGDVTTVPERMTVPAAVLFGLTRAVQHGGRAVSDDVVLRCVAHVLAAVHSPNYGADHRRHLDMARSWMAQAYLLAGVEAGAR